MASDMEATGRDGPVDPEREPAGVARLAADRLIFFSDAVVAIAITLLAIDLPVPQGDGARALLQSLSEDSIAYFTFVISFVVIAAHWQGHHNVFRYLDRIDPPFVRLNLVWLLVIVMTPFLTEVIREGDLDIVRFGLYAVAQALLLGVFSGMRWVARRHGLYRPDTPARIVSPPWWDELAAPAGFLVSIPLFPLLHAWAFALWMAVPFATGQAAARIGRRSSAAG